MSTPALECLTCVICNSNSFHSFIQTKLHNDCSHIEDHLMCTGDTVPEQNLVLFSKERSWYNNKVRMVHHLLYIDILKGHRLKFHFIRYCISFSELRNVSADPVEIMHYAAYHLGLHCLPKYPLRDFLSPEG